MSIFRSSFLPGLRESEETLGSWSCYENKFPGSGAYLGGGGELVGGVCHSW
jgi:hypothetical protein